MRAVTTVVCILLFITCSGLTYQYAVDAMAVHPNATAYTSAPVKKTLAPDTKRKVARHRVAMKVVGKSHRDDVNLIGKLLHHGNDLALQAPGEKSKRSALDVEPKVWESTTVGDAVTVDLWKGKVTAVTANGLPSSTSDDPTRAYQTALTFLIVCSFIAFSSFAYLMLDVISRKTMDKNMLSPY